MDELKKIEITKPDGCKIAGHHYPFGDVRSVPAPVFKIIFDAGWGKCCETGEERPLSSEPKRIKVDDIIQLGAST